MTHKDAIMKDYEDFHGFQATYNFDLPDAIWYCPQCKQNIPSSRIREGCLKAKEKELILPFDYQEKTRETITDKVRNMNPETRLLYYALGLGGETGEVLEKIKKLVRDQTDVNQLKDILTKELGDVCWYLNRIADEFDIQFNDILQGNIEKLDSRRERGTLHGDGDNR